MSDLVARFAELFEGNTQAYGTEEGGCVRIPGGDAHVLAWESAWHNHLEGGVPIGVYPMVCNDNGLRHGIDIIDPQWLVKWGCVDLDVKREGKRRYDYETEADAHQAALNLHKALSYLGIDGWIEITRSRGRHVWVFADGWVPAATVRRALLVACQVADVPPTEVNPKAETLPEGSLGNYVRLPYPGALTGGEDRRIVTVDGVILDLDTFLHDVWPQGASRFQEVADLWVPPKATKVELDPAQLKVATSTLTNRLNPLAWTIYEEGPLDGNDRSGTLIRLANCCKESGLSPQEALTIVTDADRRWGKYSNRPDAMTRLQDVVRRGYQ